MSQYSDFNKNCTNIILKYLQDCESNISNQQILDIGNHNILSVQTQTIQYNSNCIYIVGLQLELTSYISQIALQAGLPVEDIFNEVQNGVNSATVNQLIMQLNANNIMDPSQVNVLVAQFAQALLLGIGGFPQIDAVAICGNPPIDTFPLFMIICIIIAALALYITSIQNFTSEQNSTGGILPIGKATFT